MYEFGKVGSNKRGNYIFCCKMYYPLSVILYTEGFLPKTTLLNIYEIMRKNI